MTCPFVQLCSGEQHCLALTAHGVVYSWGCNNLCQLGRSAPRQDLERTPNVVAMKETSGMPRVIVQIACGKNHSLALSHQGALLAWGNGKSGQLALSKDKLNTPEVIMRDVKSIAAGGNSSCCVTLDNRLLVWGELVMHLKLGRDLATPVAWYCIPDDNSERALGRLGCGPTTVAATVEHKDLLEEFDIICTRLKQRQNVLTLKKRSSALNGNGRQQQQSGATGGIDELHDMSREIEAARHDIEQQIAETKESIKAMKADLEGVVRVLTIRDQQSSTLQTEAETVEAKLTGNEKNRGITTKLIDLAQFTTSISSSKNHLLEQYSALESTLAAHTYTLQELLNQHTALSRQSIVMKQLGSGSLASAERDIDKGLRMAQVKTRELRNADPFVLAQNGAFCGIRELLMVSERALGDVSSALTEVSSVCGSPGDATVLEQLLEANLKLRKGLNEVISEKLFHAEHGAAGRKGLQESAEGLIHFFKEASQFQES